MKKLVLLLGALSFSAQAYEFTHYTERTLKCKAVNQGYTVAKNIDLMFLEKNHNNTKTIEYVALNHHRSFDDYGGYADPQLGTYYGIRSKLSEDENWQFTYEIEYFSNTITVLEDDGGYKLFTSYISDGPVEYGFYDCSEGSSTEEIKDPTYIEAWSRLEKAIKANVASDYKLKIKSEAFCGEMDPYFLGDSCMYTAVRLSDHDLSEGDKEIEIYFYDYDVDKLKKDQIIDVKAITIDDYEQRFSKKPAFAVEFK